MKKWIILLLILTSISKNSKCQIITSVANGNWYMPTTWSCTCIPLPSDSVIINHNVVLDNDFALNGGSITVGPNGTLRENTPGRYLVMNSGFVTNNGTMKISRVGFYGGEFNNYDSCLFYSVFYSGADVLNFGSVSELDSLFIQSYFYNDAAGSIDVFRVTVNDTLENNGIINATDFLSLDVFYNYNEANFYNFFSNDYTENTDLITFNDFTNNGDFWNYGSMEGAADFSNIGYFYNDDIGSLILENDFSNQDSANHIAYFENEGGVYVAGNFSNGDTITGDNGHFCVSQASSNFGVMLGTFNFYDVTNGGPPDLNTGTISNGITYNVYPCVPGVGKINEPISQVAVYPNPVADNFYFEFTEIPSNAIITITNVLGNIVFEQSGISSKLVTFIKGNLSAGLYIYHVKTESQQMSGKIVFQ